ncbi:MAG: acyltransferase [Campylobacterales bacterium]|nr:acyltransferase [Campylobacterales bacterium]MBN2832938.1 acyltransferase [Campylobacterales bacterium]
MLVELIQKYKFDVQSDRLGPDCPFTHWKLYFKSLARNVCIKKFSQFGINAEFRAGAYAITCSKISLGNNVVIRPSTMLFADSRKGSHGKIIIEDNVMLGSGVHIYVANHRFDSNQHDIIQQGHYDAKDVVLKKGCWIGANVTILPGVVIGENSVVGAGSIVTKSFPKRVLIAGNPAKVIKYLDKEKNAE